MQGKFFVQKRQKREEGEVFNQQHLRHTCTWQYDTNTAHTHGYKKTVDVCGMEGSNEYLSAYNLCYDVVYNYYSLHYRDK